MRLGKKEKIKFIQNIKFKRIISVFIYVIIWICVLYNIIFLINTSITKNDYFKLFGISFFCMKNNLMEDDISKNDLVIVKEVKDKDLQNGDIIAYEVNGQIRINKIMDIKNNIYSTKSNKNYQPDFEKITINQIVGGKVMNIPFLGLVIEILQSKLTSIFIFLFLCFNFYYNKYMYTKKKQRNRIKKKLERKKGNVICKTRRI